MNRTLIILILVSMLVVPVSAMDFTAPLAPEDAQKLMPEETETFGDGLIYIMKSALNTLQPSIAEGLRVCAKLLGVSVVSGLLTEYSGRGGATVNLAGTAVSGLILFEPVNSMIRIGTNTVAEISHYGRLLLPVMTGALAAQGAVTKSGALYTATAVFDAFLSTAISDLLIPIAYIYLCVSTVCNLFAQVFLKEIKTFIKWFMTWGLKTVLYIFTGYISITGIVGGTTDATILKATKLTISGMVPVVGNILSDASEAVLVSASMMKNAAGIYGLLTVIALWLGPFLRIGVQYSLLKITAGLCEMFGTKEMTGLIKDFSSTMGLVLAMTGSVSLIFLISIICFMKGVS